MTDQQAGQLAQDVVYDTSGDADPDELLRFYERQRHAITHSPEKLERMIESTFCFVAARTGGELIGLARGVTDGVRGQLVECKLDPSYQGPACITHTDGRIEHDAAGIAREMALRVIESFRRYGVERVDVLAYETEEDFCRELGFRRSAGLVALQMDPGSAPGGVARPGGNA
ncbi:MAG: hypothetical protein ACYSUQ_02365 [Planctomycetota bacterium]|jgi:hypothetical protein